MLARLCRSMYGTRDTASMMVPLSLAVTKEISKDCVIGDDFCVVARQKQLQIFGEVLEKWFGLCRSRQG